MLLLGITFIRIRPKCIEAEKSIFMLENYKCLEYAERNRYMETYNHINRKEN